MTGKTAQIQGPVVPDGKNFPDPWGTALHNPAGVARDRIRPQDTRKRAIPRVLIPVEHALRVKS